MEEDVGMSKDKNNIPENLDGEKFEIDGHSTISRSKIPEIGMEFENEEAAYQFYNMYARAVGFSIRRHRIHRDEDGRILDRTFCCSWQGNRGKDKRDVIVKSHRPETRNGCGALMKIDGRHTPKYKVVDFIATHAGHGLVSPSKSHMLRSHRSISNEQASQANDIDISGIPPKAGFDLIVRQMGGRENVGFIFEDYKNYLQSRRTSQIRVGDTGGVLEYLQKMQLDDANFFYAIQVDQDDLITNIFWADAQMKVDYAHFGDVVCFDTTYRKNKDGRPFALFVGVNHHKQTIIFGAALLYDETAASFMWLFDIFAKAMSNKKPETILTDQDAAMAKALLIKWPETYHRLCIWHIYQNAAIHLSSVFSSFSDFSKDFSFCVYDNDEENEFLNAWQKMLDKYGLQTNEWLQRLFNIKEKWALVYGRQKFCADMTTTQRSESMNSVLKRYVNYKHNLFQFFQHFHRLIEDRRYQELKADLRTQNIPVLSFPVEILKHAASVYTYEVLQLFQDELHKAHDSKIELCGEIGDVFEYKITLFKRHRQHIVIYQSSKNEVMCSCKKFEFAGILCAHSLKVLNSRNITQISELHIKKRWTRSAKKVVFKAQHFDVNEKDNEFMKAEDEKRMIAIHYKELCLLQNQLNTRAALTLETYKIAKQGILKLIEEVDTRLEERSNVRPKSVEPKTLESKVIGSDEVSLHEAYENVENIGNEVRIKGMKVKLKKNVKSGKRPKSGLEKSKKMRKSACSNVPSSNKSIILHDIRKKELQMQNLNNLVGASMESSSLPFSPQICSLSQNSQENLLIPEDFYSSNGISQGVSMKHDRNGSAGVPGSMMLWQTWRIMHAPITQDPSPVTEDMHEE